ncbi:MAG: SUMF1/EgtB/PvdO family nonheme iron enzyme [Acidimicrobiales bacterium]|jgi:formylglycine-generating enzyme required for sulfatase activity
MSEFERGILDAKARQHRLYFLTFFMLLFLGAIVVVVLAFTSGTSIKILPIEAEQTGVISVEDGYALSVDRVVYGFPGALAVVVGANGFYEQHRQIQTEERGNKIAITLNPIPGRLVVSTAPELPNTSWFLDGSNVTISPVLDRELEPGTYTLQVNNPYFEVEERELQIKRAEMQEVFVKLKPVKGKLRVSSKPENATIKIDDQLRGAAPKLMELNGGEYKVTVEKEGYVTVEDQIVLTNKKISADRTYRMKHVSSTLTFSVKPQGGQLLLGGRKVDPSGSYEVSTNVKHTLTYFHDGFLPVTRTIILKEDENRRVSINLKPDIGKVQIHGSPSAEIYVDGKKVGEKSVTISLSAIDHLIELRKPGYRTIKRIVRPSSKREKILNENLISELTARKSESPKEYKNSTGIELKLFEPGSFNMGAPRHQKGQRANEFERKVRLRKLFYASKYEITNAQFMSFKKGKYGPSNHPVTSITWLDAAAFCNWLSSKENLSPFYKINNQGFVNTNGKADGYRLLTEAEWEWLARKAGKNKQSIFPWSDDSVVPPKAGNIADESANGLTSFYVPNYNDGFAQGAPVGQFPPESSGLFDLTGNVSEWVHDFYALVPPYRGKVYVDPLGHEYGEAHVVKGASWRSGTRTLLRPAYREGLVDKKDDVGFRIGRYLYGNEDTKKE